VALDGGLESPESLRVITNTGGDTRILISDANRLILFDPETGVTTSAGQASSQSDRVTDARPDINGNVLAAAFTRGEIDVLTDIDDVASGLFVQIDRVVADNFPQVTLEINVQDRLRRPIVGLDERNFALTEANNPVEAQTFIAAGNNDTQAAVSVIFERSPATAQAGETLAAAARDITAALPGADMTLYSAGAIPTKLPMPAGAAGLRAAAYGKASDYTPRWNIDQALRLAATELLPKSKKRAVVYVGSGQAPPEAFTTYSLSELAAYMANNGIAFYTVLTGNTAPSDEISYICNETGGKALPIYRPEGVGAELSKILTRPNGIYYLSYTSRLATNFGQEFLPVEAEVYYLERSGRDRIGYFAPLQ
jgi:hypothetical protein